MPHVLFLSARDGAWRFVNRRFTAVTGAEGERALGHGWRAFVAPDDLPAWDASWTRALAEGRPFSQRCRLASADGTYRWFLARAERAPHLDEGDTQMWLATATDVEELLGGEGAARETAGAGVPAGVLDARAVEEALRESEERCRTLFETIDRGFCLMQLVVDDDGRPADYRFIETNALFEKYTGFENARGKTVRELACNVDESWLRRYVDVALTGEPCHFENYLPDWDRWFDVYASRAGPPERRQVAIVFDDITERKRAQEALRASEERFRLVSRATNDVIWDWDLVTDELEWSDAVVRRFGLSEAELAAGIDGWTARIHPEDRDAVLTGIHEAIAGHEESWSAEYRFRSREGAYAIILDRGYIVRKDDETPVRMIGSMLDLSELRRTEAALLESESRFRALADNITQLAWIGDETGSIIWYNKRWFDFTGTTLDEMRGWGWQRVHHPDHVERVVEKLRLCFETGVAWEDTFPLRAKDGSYRWFLTRAAPIRDDEGNVTRWFGTNTDITAQREAEEALREADQRKDEFLAMLAHELRNPLAPVRNAVHILRKLGPDDGSHARVRDIIDRQVTHMARLIDDLLDVSRIARGRIELKRQVHDLVEIARQTAEDYRANLETGGISLKVTAPAEPLCVDGDSTRLAQIVGNLLHNAGKFTEPGGDIEVHLERDGGSARVVVIDSGIGMSPALLSRLFDPFSQADQDLSRSKGGLGLGLALAKGLAELHGGTLSATSEGLGRGSRFALCLPLVRQLLAHEDGAASSPAPPGRSVVVIEDNRDAAETLRMLLSLAGHAVEVAHDGRKGIDLVRRAKPDVVFCDLGLPGGIDGYDVARTLRDDHSLADTTLVALSGYSQAEDRRRSRSAGFDAHLAKPPHLSELERVLEAQPTRTRSGHDGIAPSLDEGHLSG